MMGILKMMQSRKHPKGFFSIDTESKRVSLGYPIGEIARMSEKRVARVFSDMAREATAVERRLRGK